jgi:glycosyltransferase involved in cell wall biosynthesis
MNYQPKLCSKIPESEVQQLHRQLTSNATTRDLSPSELLNLRVLNADRNPLQPKQNRQKARVAIFELHVTGEASECSFEAPFLKFRGWQSQESLPKFMAECHAIVVPTVAQEALGRTAVEAMGAARPVFASRIGGLSFTVVDGFTGLLFEPSNPSDLATKIQCLMDDVRFAQSLGSNGRDKFLNEHTWDVIIQRHYDSLFDGLIKRC